MVGKMVKTKLTHNDLRDIAKQFIDRSRINADPAIIYELLIMNNNSLAGNIYSSGAIHGSGEIRIVNQKLRFEIYRGKIKYMTITKSNSRVITLPSFYIRQYVDKEYKKLLLR